MNKRTHPNKKPFDGVLTLLDEPSDKAPSGSRGHSVVLTTAAAEDALSSLEGMALNFTADWAGHDTRIKCGVITRAYIVGNELRVSGYLYCHDFPEIEQKLSEPDVKLGMSYDMVDVHIASQSESVWRITSCCFTGAAILLRDKAAYKATSFNLSAAAEVFTGRMQFVSEAVLELKEE